MNIFQVSELSASFHTIGVGYNSLVEVGSFFALLTLIFLTFLAPSLSRVTRVLPPTHWLRIVTNLLTPSYLSISICTFEKEQFSKEREREKKQTDKTFILITADGGGSVPDSTLRVYSISNGWKVGKLLVLCDLNGCEDDGSEVNNKRHWIKLGGWMHSKIARHNRRREMCIQLSCCAPLGSFTRRAGATVERQRAAAIDADVYTTGVWRYQLGFFSLLLLSFALPSYMRVSGSLSPAADSTVIPSSRHNWCRTKRQPHIMTSLFLLRSRSAVAFIPRLAFPFRSHVGSWV